MRAKNRAGGNCCPCGHRARGLGPCHGQCWRRSLFRDRAPFADPHPLPEGRHVRDLHQLDALMSGMQHRVTGHFGEWLQGRLGPSGPVALITLPCPALHVTAERLQDGEFRLCQVPMILPEARARKFLSMLELPCEGHYRLAANMPAGGGAGSSAAALLALARAAGHDGEGLARACIAAEGASDPLMLDAPDAVLWAPREGKVLGI